mmetsp:Transcript_9280/g.27651  ORF Transcript_9280/g.27651 Transcript_9280/m.27651 type:complete len:256 (-) Transcript_9280:1468-2235(-)
MPPGSRETTCTTSGWTRPPTGRSPWIRWGFEQLELELERERELELELELELKPQPTLPPRSPSRRTPGPEHAATPVPPIWIPPTKPPSPEKTTDRGIRPETARKKQTRPDSPRTTRIPTILAPAADPTRSRSSSSPSEPSKKAVPVFRICPSPWSEGSRTFGSLSRNDVKSTATKNPGGSTDSTRTCRTFGPIWSGPRTPPGDDAETNHTCPGKTLTHTATRDSTANPTLPTESWCCVRSSWLSPWDSMGGSLSR